MASTLSRKRSRRSSPAKSQKPSKQPSTVGDMTPAQLRQLIEEVLDERMSDPDAGLVLRPEIMAELKEQEKRVAAGDQGKPLAEVMKEIGLE